MGYSGVLDMIQRNRNNRNMQKQNRERYNELKGMSEKPSGYIFNKEKFGNKNPIAIEANRLKIQGAFRRERRIIFIKTFITMLILTFIWYLIF